MARTVLLADDSVTAQNMGRRILMDAGYEVITVNNGSAALKKIHESPPDLIVLDVYMPGYGGLEVCQRLKESGETMRIPVLLTVGKMEPFKGEEAKRVRADGHIVKPFDASELLAALTKLEDRIVPQAESQRGRKGKAEKKSRFWQARDTEPGWSDGVAFLAEVKEREAHGELAHDSGIEKVEEAVTKAEMAAPTTENQLKALPVPEPAPVAPPREFEVHETTVAPEEVGGEQVPGSQPSEDETATQAVAMAATHTQEAAEQTPVAAAPPEQISIASDSPPAPTEGVPVEAGGVRWVAENVALTAEEASLELEQEMRQAQAVSSSPVEPPAEREQPEPDIHDAIASALPAPEAKVADEPEKGPESFDSGATFAAVAGASADSGAVVVPVSTPESQGEPPVASDARAAWENWQRIRDSVMSVQEQTVVSNSVAEAARAIASEPAHEGDKSEPSPVLENAALASIVDSVLAELKPKLMEEIAKKLKK